MQRPLVFGILAPVVSGLTFTLLVLALTLLADPSQASRAAGQWVALQAGAFSPGHLAMYAPTVLLGLLAMTPQRRAGSASTLPGRWLWRFAAVALLGLPELAVGFIVMPNVLAAAVSAAVAGTLAYSLASNLAPAKDDTNLPDALVKTPAITASRSQFGRRGL